MKIGGVEASDIAAQFGTPVYVYDADTIKSQYHRLKNAFSGVKVSLHYALKALNNVNVLRLLKQEGAGLDAVSIQEVHLGLRAGFPLNKSCLPQIVLIFLRSKQPLHLGFTLILITSASWSNLVTITGPP